MLQYTEWPQKTKKQAKSHILAYARDHILKCSNPFTSTKSTKFAPCVGFPNLYYRIYFSTYNVIFIPQGTLLAYDNETLMSDQQAKQNS